MENPAFSIELDSEIEISKNGSKPKKDTEKVYTFEEAVSLTGTGKYHYFLLLVCGFCFMSVMVEVMGVSVIMPYTKCDLASTISEQGILASSGFFGIVLSSHLMGFLADTWGRVKTLRSALVLSFISTVISAFSVNIWMLIVFRFFNGFFISGCQACVFSYLGEFHGRNTRVKYVTLLSMFMPIGLICLPSFAIGILPMDLDAAVGTIRFKPWRLLLLVNSALSLISLFGILITGESPKYDLIQRRNEEAIQTLRKIFTWNTGRPESEYPVKQVHMEISGANLSDIRGVKDASKLIWDQTAPLFYRERVWHTINICCLMFIIYGIAQGTFMWFPTILHQLVQNKDQGYLMCESMTMLGHVAVNSTAADSCGGPVDTFMFEVMIMIGAAFTAIYILFAFTIDIVGKKGLLLIWFTITVACCLAIHWVSSFVMSVILLTIIISIGNCGGIISTISIEYFPTNISAMAMCLIMMLARLGAVAISNIFGVTIMNGCDALFYVYVVVISVVAAFSLLLPDKGKTKNILKQTQNIESNKT